MCRRWRGRESSWRGAVCGKRFPRFPRRDASPLTPRLSPFCCPLSGTPARASDLVHLILGVHTEYAYTRRNIYAYTRSWQGSRVHVHAELSHHRNTEALAAGGEGGDATGPPEMLQGPTTRDLWPPVSMERRRGRRAALCVLRALGPTARVGVRRDVFFEKFSCPLAAGSIRG